MLEIDSVDGPIVVIALDVRVDVRPMLADVNAVRALEARRLAALVFEVPVQPAVPLVDLAALGALVGAGCRGAARRHGTEPALVTGGRDVDVAGATVESCKAQVDRQSETAVHQRGRNDNT